MAQPGDEAQINAQFIRSITATSSRLVLDEPASQGTAYDGSLIFDVLVQLAL
jgi:hypothetical protein